MSKYINLDRVKEVFDYAENEFCECDYAVKNIREAVENLPAADVKPVVLGKWEERNVEGEHIFFNRRFYCSACGGWNTYGKPKYCPDCGARMEK